MRRKLLKFFIGYQQSILRLFQFLLRTDPILYKYPLYASNPSWQVPSMKETEVLFLRGRKIRELFQIAECPVSRFVLSVYRTSHPTCKRRGNIGIAGRNRSHDSGSYHFIGIRFDRLSYTLYSHSKRGLPHIPITFMR
jgi:hypothetical protein